MLRRGFIFSLDSLAAFYIMLIFLFLLVSFIEVKYKNESLETVILLDRANDLSLYYHYTGKIPKHIVYDYNLKIGNCMDSNQEFNLFILKYPDISTGYPSRWFQAGKTNKNVININLGSLCFRGG